MPCWKVTLILTQQKKTLLSDWFVVIKNLSKLTVQLNVSALIFRPNVRLSPRAPSHCYLYVILDTPLCQIYIYIYSYSLYTSQEILRDINM